LKNLKFCQATPRDALTWKEAARPQGTRTRNSNKKFEQKIRTRNSNRKFEQEIRTRNSNKKFEQEIRTGNSNRKFEQEIRGNSQEKSAEESLEDMSHTESLRVNSLKEHKILPGNTQRDLPVEVDRPKIMKETMEAMENIHWSLQVDVSRSRTTNQTMANKCMYQAKNGRNEDKPICYDSIIQKMMKIPSCDET